MYESYVKYDVKHDVILQNKPWSEGWTKLDSSYIRLVLEPLSIDRFRRADNGRNQKNGRNHKKCQKRTQ